MKNTRSFAAFTMVIMAMLTPAVTHAQTADSEKKLNNALAPASAATIEGSPLRWYDAAELTLEGKGWDDTNTTFSRLPARCKGIVTDAVWGLSSNTAGLIVRFITDSKKIGAIWDGGTPMRHMAATGSHGLDLYRRDGSGWKYAGTGRPGESSSSGTLETNLSGGTVEYMMYLPLYGPITSLKLGIDADAQLAPAPPRDKSDKPIVFYGTSITQGGCASRAGMCHPAILGRWLNREVINLGFSGSGRMEMPMADLLAEIDAAVYVLECLPNMKLEMVKERIEPFVKSLREKRPGTPIVLVENPLKASDEEQNAALRAAYNKLESDNVPNIHYLESEKQLAGRENGTVDGVHPTDLGFLTMAEAYEPFLKEILGSGSFTNTPTTAPAVANPVHAQLDELIQFAAGKRLAILSNGSAHDGHGYHDIQYLMKSEQTTITAFFGPEHGFQGTLQDGAKAGDYVDSATGIPVYSLYGQRKAPTDEQLANVDILVFDIPDIGARFYTYEWTMIYAMEACAKNGKAFVVIDRPNPITGSHVEGAVNTTDLGLIGRLGENAKFGVATRHGLTVGELATMWNAEYLQPKADLRVIKAQNWKRDQWLDETGRPFVAPSPNMRSLAAATVYPGTCIFEGTNLNEGRGTPTPFEVMGAPFVDGKKWADDLNSRKLPGVTFEATRFTPDSRRFKGQECGGVRIKVTDREVFEPVRTGIHMLHSVKKLYPDQVKITDYAGRLMAVLDLDKRIVAEEPDAIVQSWQSGLEDFKKLREKHLLYK